MFIDRPKISDRCQQEKRKTINGEDILFAMNALGFDNYVEPLKIYLQKYREWVKQVSCEMWSKFVCSCFKNVNCLSLQTYK